MVQPTLTPELLVPRLGEYLVQQGYIDNAELKKALAFQKERAESRRHVLLGQALLELKLVDRPTLDAAITELIIHLRKALEDANKNLEVRVRERTAELQEALSKLSELNQLKANFVSNISHELRTPLTHVKGYLELLANESLGSMNEEQKNAVEVSRHSAGQLESLIDSLILFSQTVRGGMTLHLSPVDLNIITAKVMDYLRPKAVEKNISLNKEIHSDLPFVQADSEKIYWTILQLVENAIKFTSAGGEVTLSIQPESEKLIRVAVSDTGIGIPAGRQKEIFEPFHQLDGSSRRQYGGTGLGLALVQEILNAHGSTIEVKSKEGKGSLFRFALLAVEKPE